MSYFVAHTVLTLTEVKFDRYNRLSSLTPDAHLQLSLRTSEDILVKIIGLISIGLDPWHLL